VEYLVVGGIANLTHLADALNEPTRQCWNRGVHLGVSALDSVAVNSLAVLD
jgi:hypothetical protein